MAVFSFLRSSNFAVEKCDVSVIFTCKVGQVCALEAVFFGRDVIGVLPTGHGKSLIFQLIPDLIAFKMNVRDERDAEVKRRSIITIVCPLDSLIENHAKSLNENALFYDVMLMRTTMTPVTMII